MKQKKLKQGAMLIGIALATGSIAQTTGYVPKWNGTSYVNTATPIYEDAVNSRIGIGTTSPAYKLDVNGDIHLPLANAIYAGPYKWFWNNNDNANVLIGSNAGNGGSMTGNDNVYIGFDAGYYTTSGNGNTYIGYDAGLSTTTGSNNSFTGNLSGYTNTSGSSNSFYGEGTGFWNSTGNNNGFFGNEAGGTNSSGARNNAHGFRALYSNSTGNNNSAFGDSALYSNTGSNNSAFGYGALRKNTSGSPNEAFGNHALYSNTTGFNNTAVGDISLQNNTTGNYNQAFGSYSMNSNTTGSNNSAVGLRALNSNTTGDNNSGIGYQVLYSTTTGTANVGCGLQAGYTNSTGSNNTFVGYTADANSGTLSNATALGNGTIVNASNKVRLGNTNVTVVEGPVAYTFSDKRFKFNITDEIKGLEFIKKLHPVSYQYDSRKMEEFLTKNMKDSVRQMHLKADFSASTKVIHSGFIAQEVEQAAKECNYKTDIVHTPENESDNYSVAYGVIVVPLVKAVQEQQQLIEGQQKEMNEMKDQIKKLTALVNASQNNASTGINIDLSDKNVIVLNQNAPNPFAEQTTITYNIPESAQSAQIQFYGLNGALIRTVDLVSKGSGKLNVYASDLSNGIYSYSLIVDGKISDTKKMVKQN